MKKNIKSKRLVKSSSEKQYKTFDEVKIGDTAIDFNDEKSKVIDKGTFEENMSYFTWSIPGHDDYYKFEKIDGVWYIFWITRYDPNF